MAMNELGNMLPPSAEVNWPLCLAISQKMGPEYQLSKMKKEGHIKRIGPDKSGSWEVVDKAQA